MEMVARIIIILKIIIKKQNIIIEILKINIEYRIEYAIEYKIEYKILN